MPATKVASAVSTKSILSDFPRGFSDEKSGKAAEKQKKLDGYNALDERQRDVLERLKRAAAAKASPSSLTKLLGSRGPPAPTEKDLVSLVTHYFPPRADTLVQVFDFGDEHATRTEIRLGDVEQAMHSKPDWASVRWIHAPLGIGLFHSSVEALFFHSGSKTMGREFEAAGRGGWPYLEMELLSIRNIQDLANMQIISGLCKDKELAHELNRLTFQGDNNATLRSNIEWRAGHVGVDISFRESVESDIPWQLSEGGTLNMGGPFKGIRTAKSTLDHQSLRRLRFFKDAQLVRDPFRTFHRSDGQ